MNVEHSSCFLSWFADRSKSHEQDGETLRANCLQTASGDPAMAFEPSVTGLGFPSPACAGSTLRPGLAADATETPSAEVCAEDSFRADWLQRRMPSFSIRLL
jgi:hypothetical protein